jgi:hypothetical protein
MAKLGVQPSFIMLCDERLSAWIDCMRGLVSRVICPVGDGISLLSKGLLTKRTVMGLDNHCAIGTETSV